MNQQHHGPSALITSTSVANNSGTTVVTNELVATKKVVHTKTISPPVLIQVKQESSSSSPCLNPNFPKPQFVSPSISSEQQNKTNETLIKALASSSQLVAIKSEPLTYTEVFLERRIINIFTFVVRECFLSVVRS